MFVRWKRRQLRSGHDVSHDAVIVESRWRNGATQQRFVCYVACIRERYLTAPAHRDLFWRQAEERLNKIELSPDTRRIIEARLADVVPRPSEEELSQVNITRTMFERFDS